jgi:threonine dehydrogenase-like Zn-dependent dehydrogenase
MFVVPDGLPDDVAVLTELFAVTHSLDLAARMPRPGGLAGDTVAVIGVGPVGVVHVAEAALLGASRVIGVDRFAARLAIASEFGASDVVVATDAIDVAAEARRLTGGAGVDVVVDATGHPSSFAAALACLRDGDTLLEVGAFVDLGPVDFNPADLLGRNLTLVGAAGEDSRIYDATLQMLAAHHERVPFHRAVTHRFPSPGRARPCRRLWRSATP